MLTVPHSLEGLSLADIVVEKQEPFNSSNLAESLPTALRRLEDLDRLARAELAATIDEKLDASSLCSSDSIEVTKYLSCRYSGTDTSMMTNVEGKEPPVVPCSL